MRTRVSFVKAVAAAECLKLKLGLSALKKSEGKDRIHQGQWKVLGSVNIDDDCRPAWPNSERWDYVIGLSDGKTEESWFIEVHSAHTSEVSKMERKLRWLLDFLNRQPQTALRSQPRQVRWVASGSLKIPKNTPQYRSLKTGSLGRALGWPVQRLDLP